MALRFTIFVATCLFLMGVGVCATAVNTPTDHVHGDIVSKLDRIDGALSGAKLMFGVVASLFAALIGVISYAYLSDKKNTEKLIDLNTKRLDEAFKLVEGIQKESLTLDMHDKLCPGDKKGATNA